MKTIQISIRIILMFATIIFASFIPDYFHNFFGDELCNGFIMRADGYMEQFFHIGGKHSELIWHWGFRHWMWLLMGLSLFVIQLIDLVKKSS